MIKFNLSYSAIKRIFKNLHWFYNKHNKPFVRRQCRQCGQFLFTTFHKMTSFLIDIARDFFHLFVLFFFARGLLLVSELEAFLPFQEASNNFQRSKMIRFSVDHKWMNNFQLLFQYFNTTSLITYCFTGFIIIFLILVSRFNCLQGSPFIALWMTAFQ